MEAQKERAARRHSTLLRSADQLPDVDDEEVTVVWDFEEADGDSWTILRTGELQIWREAAFWEGIGRLQQVAAILAEKYGSRLVEIRPTERSKLYLRGDRWDADELLETINESLRTGATARDVEADGAGALDDR